MVCKLRERIELAGFIINDGPFDWGKATPFKILAFVWRAKLGRIPFAMALSHRGVNMPTIMCGACNNDEETCDHILISCPMAKEIIDLILNWCGIGCEKLSSVKDMLCFI